MANSSTSGTVEEHIFLPLSNSDTVRGEPNTLVQQGVKDAVPLGSSKFPL